MEKIYVCGLCSNKSFVRKANLVRHLTSVHRKQRYPKDETLKSAFDIANEGARMKILTNKGNINILPIIPPGEL
jgi:hypothetical protein